MTDLNRELFTALAPHVDGPTRLAEALIEVLHLHLRSSGSLPPFCMHDEQSWPCATVSAIAVQLGIVGER